MKKEILATTTPQLITEDNLTLLTTEEAAEMLMCGRNTIYALLKEKKIKGMRIGSSNWWIPKAAIYEYIRNETNL